MIKKDILRTYNMLGGGTVSRIIGCYRTPGVHAAAVFRFGQWLLKRNLLLKILLTPVYVFLFHRIRTKWGIEIPRKTQIGEGFYIGHFGGIVISENCKIGKNVNISQNGTIGVAGRGEKRGWPVIGDHVYIAPGAKIFGAIRIGDHVKIGANAVISKDIPDNAIVAMAPGFKILSFRGNSREERNSDEERGLNE